jgi:tryptophanyl-tRNA synthetase
MSASIETSAIFMKDTSNQIKNKVNRYAFSGGQVSEAEHREKGGDASVDVSFQYLTFFLEDDEELEKIRVAYEKGQMLTGELKAICILHLQEYVKAFQERRSTVTEEIIDQYMALRPLEWKANPNPIKARQLEGQSSEAPADGAPKLTKNQEKKLAKEKMIAEKKAAKEREKAQK